MSETRDVIVVGAGLAGWSAALSAAEEGADVVLLEKQAESGGSTILSGGFFSFAGTDMQMALGLEDTPAKLERDLIAVGEGKNDPDLVSAFAHGQLGLYDWMVQRGAIFTDIELSSGQSVARSHRADPSQVIASFREVASRQLYPLTCRFDCAVSNVTVGEDGSASGVVTADGKHISARGGVILTSGGFSRSEQLLKRFAPRQAAALRIGGAGNVGDGLRMAMDIGAGSRDFEFIKGTFGTHPSTQPDQHEILLAFYLGALIINTAGERFVDESISYKLLGDACLDQPDARAFQVFDSAVYAASKPGVPLFDFQPMLDRGLLIRDDTLDGLATKVGMDADALVASLTAYNDSLSQVGYDRAFGRRHLCFTSGDLVPIAKPPFYAFPSTTALLATYCGLTVSSDTEVINMGHKPIRGLYAAGEIVGGFHGAAYMTGSSLAKAAFFGRRAGALAAFQSKFVGRSAT